PLLFQPVQRDVNRATRDRSPRPPLNLLANRHRIRLIAQAQHRHQHHLLELSEKIHALLLHCLQCRHSKCPCQLLPPPATGTFRPSAESYTSPGASQLPGVEVLASALDSRRPRRAVPLPASKGLIDVPSRHSVDETVDKLRSILQAKGVTLFALIDH